MTPICFTHKAFASRVSLHRRPNPVRSLLTDRRLTRTNSPVGSHRQSADLGDSRRSDVTRSRTSESAHVGRPEPTATVIDSQSDWLIEKQMRSRAIFKRAGDASVARPKPFSPRRAHHPRARVGAGKKGASLCPPQPDRKWRSPSFYFLCGRCVAPCRNDPP